MHDTAAFDLPLLALLLSAAALLVLAYRTSIPYPILLVIGGAGIGFVPGLPAVELPPEAVLVIFLPPLLYAPRSSPRCATCATTNGRSGCWRSGSS